MRSRRPEASARPWTGCGYPLSQTYQNRWLPLADIDDGLNLLLADLKQEEGGPQGREVRRQEPHPLGALPASSPLPGRSRSLPALASWR